MIRKVPVEYLSVQVTPELKQALRKQAKRAGLSLSECVVPAWSLSEPI